MSRSTGSILAVAAAAKPAPKDNAAVAFAFFRRKGLSRAQAAGIVGNLQQESNVTPGSNQAGGPGRGIAQWSEGARWDALVKYARARHTNPNKLNTQLNFIWHELTSVPDYGLEELRRAKTVAAATRVFQDRYERCGECNEPRRIAMAQQSLRNYGG